MKLDVYHHKFFMAVFVVVVFIIGVLFGVKVSGTAGLDAMVNLLFGLAFIDSVLLYVIFTQLVHVRDDLAQRKVRK